MARTKEEIFDELIAGKENDPVLSVMLSSQSKTAVYRVLFAMYAEVTGDFELSFDDFETRLTDLLVSKQVHNAAWWRNLALSFQLGDPLITLDNGNLSYPVTDTDKQIIQRAAVISPPAGGVTVKVAKLNGNTPEPLSSFESSAFAAYVNDTGPAGITATIVTVDGDEIQINITATIDTQLINLTDGTLIADGTTKPVEAAVYSYFTTFQAESFGGTYYTSQQQGEILTATGVVSVVINTLTKKSSGDPGFIDVLGLTGQKFETFSGYVRLASGYDLTANIVYNAE